MAYTEKERTETQIYFLKTKKHNQQKSEEEKLGQYEQRDGVAVA